MKKIIGTCLLIVFLDRAYANGSNSCFEETMSDVIENHLAEVLRLSEVTDGIEHLQTLVAADSGEQIGSIRLWKRKNHSSFLVLSISFPDLQMTANLGAGFTPAGSPMPHFLFDMVQSDKGISFFVDHLAKNDLVMHPELLRKNYLALESVFSDANTDEDLKEGPLPPLFKAFLSPWSISKTANVQHCSVAKAYIKSYLSQWAVHGKELIWDDRKSNLVRDRFIRKQLFSNQVDPAWDLVDERLGSKVGMQIRRLFQRL